MEVNEVKRRRRARLVRMRMFATVLLNVTLALAITSGVIWLAGRPGMRVRVDLTVNEANTLDENARQVIDNLQGQLEIDVFFRPFGAPLDHVGGEIQGRMYDILALAEDYAPGKVKLTNHPYAAPGSGGAELLAQMRELGVTESNLFVVSNGRRRVAMMLLGEVAEVDLGNPSRARGAYRPPSIISFRGVETLVKAILRVTQGEQPLALFVTGHGERAIFESEADDLGRLHTALVEDGFRVETWDPSEDGEVPKDCSVLAMIGGEEPLPLEGTQWIKDYVRGGGSLIAAPGLFAPESENSLDGILRSFGIDVQRGFVCRPVINAARVSVSGVDRVAEIIVRAAGMRKDHPITEVLRKGDRRIRFIFGRAMDRGKAPNGGILLDLLRSDNYSWLELPGPDQSVDWEQDKRVEPDGPFSMAMTSVFAPDTVGVNPVGEVSAVQECRVLAVGTPEVFVNALYDVNRDFLLNAFNWAANREFRVSVSPMKVYDRRLDIGHDQTLFYMNLIAVWFLPLLCLCLAFHSAWRRRR